MHAEEQPRLDVPNFYYAQEDELYAAAKRDGFTWSVHRPHTIIGKAIVADCVSQWRRYALGKRTIGFAVSETAIHCLRFRRLLSNTGNLRP